MQITENMQEERSDENTAQLRNEAVKIAVLVGLALYFAYNIFSGNLTNYINQRFAWLSYVAVVIFAALAAANAYALYKRDFAPAYEGHTGPLHWSVIAFAAVPLLLGTLIPSQPLGADAINGGVSLSVSTVSASSSLARAPQDRNVLDWLRVFGSENSPTSFDDQPADLIGFVYREPDFPEGHFMVARFTMSCCVADAQPIGLPVYAPAQNADLVAGEWVRIAGTFRADLFRDRRTPIIQAATIEVVDQPEHPYLYP